MLFVDYNSEIIAIPVNKVKKTSKAKDIEEIKTQNNKVFIGSSEVHTPEGKILLLENLGNDETVLEIVSNKGTIFLLVDKVLYEEEIYEDKLTIGKKITQLIREMYFSGKESKSYYLDVD